MASNLTCIDHMKFGSKETLNFASFDINIFCLLVSYVIVAHFSPVAYYTLYLHVYCDEAYIKRLGYSSM